MGRNICNELFKTIYIVKAPQEVHSFDWDFVLPVTEELDKLDEKYLLAYSHYTNDQDEKMPDNYLRFRLFGTTEVMKCFQEIETSLIRKLGYLKEEDDFSFEGQAEDFGITVEEMMKIFELWSRATRLKIELIKLWSKGSGSSWHRGTHYALNTLGLVKSLQLPFQYREEEFFIRRNFPLKTSE